MYERIKFLWLIRVTTVYNTINVFFHTVQTAVFITCNLPPTGTASQSSQCGVVYHIIHVRRATKSSTETNIRNTKKDNLS